MPAWEAIQNPARERLSGPWAFLALMFLNKRVMPETSNFRGGMSAIILGPLLFKRDATLTVKTVKI